MASRMMMVCMCVVMATVKRMGISKRESRGCTIHGGIGKPMELKVEQWWWEETTKSCGQCKVPKSRSCHGPKSTQATPKPKTMLVKKIRFRRRRRSCFRPLPCWAVRDVDTWNGLRSRIGRAFTTAIQRNQLLLLDEGFTNWALLRLGMNTEPFIKARPAEKMTTQSHNRVLSQVQADVAFEITSIIVIVAWARRALGRPAWGFPKTTSHSWDNSVYNCLYTQSQVTTLSKIGWKTWSDGFHYTAHYEVSNKAWS